MKNFKNKPKIKNRALPPILPTIPAIKFKKFSMTPNKTLKIKLLKNLSMIKEIKIVNTTRGMLQKIKTRKMDLNNLQGKRKLTPEFRLESMVLQTLFGGKE